MSYLSTSPKLKTRKNPGPYSQRPSTCCRSASGVLITPKTQNKFAATYLHGARKGGWAETRPTYQPPKSWHAPSHCCR